MRPESAVVAGRSVAASHLPAIDRQAELMAQGYCIIPGAARVATIAAIGAALDPLFERTPFCIGGFYGETTKRFGRLLARAPQVASLALDPTILGLVETTLLPWCDTIQLNVTQAISVHPGAPAQLPHRDQGMWRAPPGAAEYLVNVIWPLTEFTAANGATRVWPRSHGTAALETDVAGDPVAAEMRPGDALVFLGSTLHGAGANAASNERRAIVIGYSLGWLKPYENLWLAYPPDVARSFPPALAALAGYRQHRPNLGNYEGQCPSILLDGEAGDAIAATDALLPEHAEVLEMFLRSQRDG